MPVRARTRPSINHRFSDAPLLAAAAILAAAIANGVVETLASTGIVGAGYSDPDRSSVMPASLAGLLVTFALLVLRSLRAWHTCETRVPVRNAGPPVLLRRLPIVFCLQMVVVFAMESSEQVLAHGRLADAGAWLGGPAWFSLAFHAAACLIVTAVLYRTMNSLVTKVVDILREAKRLLRARFEDAYHLLGRSVPSRVFLALAPGVRRTRGRAPPRELAST